MVSKRCVHLNNRSSLDPCKMILKVFSFVLGIAQDKYTIIIVIVIEV
jgi:hypothetical protein